MISSYPPGVTGNEYQIAGADHEEDAEFYCVECGADVHGSVEYYHGGQRFFHDLPVAPPQSWSETPRQHLSEWMPRDDGPDEDELYDRMRDDRAEAQYELTQDARS